MSIHDNLHYEIYKVSNVEPEWMKNERYEYCEDFYRSLASRAGDSIRRLVSKLHSFLL